MTTGGRQAAGACWECSTDTDHCHGGVLVHLSGETECMLDDECELGLEAHVLRVDCSVVEPRCDCGKAGRGTR